MHYYIFTFFIFIILIKLLLQIITKAYKILQIKTLLFLKNCNIVS
jgi:hypothetical protein